MKFPVKMKIRFLITLLSLVCYTISYSQTSTIRGKITDDSGETLTGATVVIKGTGKGAITDIDGNYSILVNNSTPQVIVVSFISYKAIEDTVFPSNQKVLIKNFVLQPSSVEMKEVVVTGKSDRATDNYVKIKRINAPVSMDLISKETIKKTGDSQIDDAMKRISGVSLVGGYITVRGLADRYITTTLNGLRIPTLDPLRNNIKMDMFPAAMIDNVAIHKSLSPDLPGDWAGSFISVETKDYPEKMILSIKTSFGYNPNSSFKDITSSQRSSTDWLGFDNGFREIDHSKFPEYNAAPALFEEFVALGLGEYLNQHGISEKNLPGPVSDVYVPHSNDKNYYFRLGLVQMGLLDAGKIEDSKAVFDASSVYENNPEYKNKAHTIINGNHAAFAKSLPENWTTSKKAVKLDFSQDIVIGNQIQLFGKPMGIIAGLRYSSSSRYDGNAHYSGVSPPLKKDSGEELLLASDYYRNLGISTNQWSGLLSLAYKFTPNHSLSLMFMPNFSAINTCYSDSGKTGTSVEFDYILPHVQKFEERKQIVYQLHSKHFFPVWGLRMELQASFTNGQSNVPDYRTFTYGKQPRIDIYGFSPSYKPERVYRYLTDNIFDSHFFLEFPLTKKTGLSRKMKIGADYMMNLRKFKQYTYVVGGQYQGLTFSSAQNAIDYMAHNTFDSIPPQTYKLVHYYNPRSDITDSIKGYSSVSAAFAMLDFSLSKRIRIAAGGRIEISGIYTDAQAFYKKNIANNDPVRFLTSSNDGNYFFNRASRRETNILPSGNVIIKMLAKKWGIVNARIGYGKSLGRFTLREVSPYYQENIELGTDLYGQPDLKMVKINNYDLRFESFFSNGDNFSLSSFYKEFTNHIELQQIFFSYTWLNSPGISKAYGFELEGKKNLGKNFDIAGNVTYIESQSLVSFTKYDNGGGVIEHEEYTREMYGQSPYLINGIFSYNSEKTGISAAVSYNVQGPKLIVVTFREINPDIYEMPRHLIDIKVAKRIGKHIHVEFKVRDLLHKPVKWAYKHNNYSNNNRIQNFGSTYLFGIGYDL